MMEEKISQAAELIRNSKHTTVFTGAGISVESGIPPFRGKGGLWNTYDPAKLEISYFHAHPAECWGILKEIFYDLFGKAAPNDAHKGVAELEQKGYAKAVITQNIDNLHQEAGSKTVYEFHGTSRLLRCMTCYTPFEAQQISLEKLPPMCRVCMGLLKPDFIFFGEGIPKEVSFQSFYEAQIADVFLVIGTTGEVMPACEIPFRAKKNGAKIIEINPEPSNFTPGATDIFLRGKATEMMNRIVEKL
ncbi:MAG: NAD-dependent deacylase [bacterium]|nr:NAD-dependent deacylase [bacterium]